MSRQSLRSQTFCHLFAALLWLVVATGRIAAEDSCWSNTQVCRINAVLHQGLPQQDATGNASGGVQMEINCLRPSEHSPESEGAVMVAQRYATTQSDFALRRFLGVQAVTLDGCQTPLSTHTFGFEFLPNCRTIEQLTLERFHMDTFQPLSCPHSDPEQPLRLQTVRLTHNKINTINSQSFDGKLPRLSNLIVAGNSLRLIEHDAFRSLPAIKAIHIHDEPTLPIKSTDLFENSSATSVHLSSVKQVSPELFQHLPVTLQQLYVAQTPIEGHIVELINAGGLRNATIINGALRIFSLNDVHLSVTYLNLSNNMITYFTATQSPLETLDLSSNQLLAFPVGWLQNLRNLRRLILRDNYIKRLSLYDLLRGIPSVHIIDLRVNELQSLLDIDKEVDDGRDVDMFSRVRILCDRNPWNCLWLHNFAHTHPEKFHILQYEKYISRINVNGLGCCPAERSPATLTPHPMNTPLGNRTVDPSAVMNISTYTLIYGSPWEFKRNQRTDAWVIVFILPLGIAFLFLLLCMWIYCQKVFHLSYYKSLRKSRPPTPTSPAPARFDVVRQLSTNTASNTQDNEGYELPLNNVASACNCKPTGSAGGSTKQKKCKKDYHITYEALPTEQLYKIYEDIISVDSEGVGGKSKPKPS